MIKKIAVLIFAATVLLLNTGNVFAEWRPTHAVCNPGIDWCPDKFSCQLYAPPNEFRCMEDNTKASFGTIKAPVELLPFTSPDPTGRVGISMFLTNLVALIYSLAAVVLILMILWGAWDWLTSEGDKEKLESAKKKLINAIIGLMLFAVAFAVIQILGHFTGFTFFVGQK